jgi:hypothetical protein
LVAWTQNYTPERELLIISQLQEEEVRLAAFINHTNNRTRSRAHMMGRTISMASVARKTEQVVEELEGQTDDWQKVIAGITRLQAVVRGRRARANYAQLCMCTIPVAVVVVLLAIGFALSLCGEIY